MTEVWLESLSMHLSVGMPLPPDLLFDIQHYRGLSPNSSGSNTPDSIPSGHRSPALEPITEGKMSLPITETFIKPIIKVSSAENLINKDDSQVVNRGVEYPTYENVDFLKKDRIVSEVDHSSKFNVQLKNVPKNFMRSRFVQEEGDENCSVKDKVKFHTGKISNLNLQSMSVCPSRITQKYVSHNIVQKSGDSTHKNIPDVVSSTLNRPSCSPTKASTNFSISKNIFKKQGETTPEFNNLCSSRRRFMKISGTPVLQRRKPCEPKSDNNVVKNIIDTLNGKDGDSINRNSFGRCSLRVTGTKKGGANTSDEYTNL